MDDASFVAWCHTHRWALKLQCGNVEDISRLLAMSDEALRLRAEVEKLRRVRDAAEAYRSVSTLRGYAAAQATWETLCAALDAIAWDE